MADDEPGDDVVLRAVGELSAKLDTVAGALASIAASHADLLSNVTDAESRRSQEAQELAQRLAALESQTEDRLAAIRDAAAVPVADLQALLQARTQRDDTELAELGTAIRGPAEDGPAAIREQLGELQQTLGDLADRDAPPDPTAPVLERLDELGQAITALTWQLPELAGDLTAVRERVEGLELRGPLTDAGDELASRLIRHTDTALAGLLRLLDDRLASLRRALTDAMAAQQSNVGGFEAGAVMGATQAAWNRLEQRLDSEFDDLGRQLQAMAALVEQVSTNAEAVANRPVVTGDQIRRAASAMKDSVVSAGRSRRDRRGGPRGLGSGH